MGRMSKPFALVHILTLPQRSVQYELFWTLILPLDILGSPALLAPDIMSMYLQVQVPKAIQSNAAVLSPLTNSPRENSCESPVPAIEQKISRRSRSFKKTPEKQQRVSSSPKQNDNCQVQWLVGCHVNFPFLFYYFFLNAIFFRMFMHWLFSFVNTVQGQLYCMYFVSVTFLI